MLIKGVSVDVDAGGVIDINFPIGYTLETFCENEKTSQLVPTTPGAFTCVSTEVSQTYSIANY